MYAFSSDEAQSWTELEILESDPQAGYCYTAIYIGEAAVLLSYCAGEAEKDKACLNRTRIRRIPLNLLRETADAGC